jgi:hypothetical protein
MAETALDKAITAAVAEVETPPSLPASKETEETEVPETEETSDEEEETPEEDSEGEMSEDEVKESRQLYKLLKDPTSRNAVLTALASQAGLLPKGEDKPTKSETAAAKREIKDILSEALGTEYSFLAERLSKGIDKVLEQERSENESKLLTLQRQNVEREVVAEHNRLARETKGESKKFEARMAELSSEIPVGNQDMRTYIKRLYTIASSEKQIVKSAQKTDQVRKNATDVSSRLKSGASPLSNNEIPDKKMSLDDSIKFALDQERKGKR